MAKQRSDRRVVKSLLELRKELAHWKMDYVSKTIVGQIDACLYDVYPPKPEKEVKKK